jgi:hypothetical protein
LSARSRPLHPRWGPQLLTVVFANPLLILSSSKISVSSATWSWANPPLILNSSKIRSMKSQTPAQVQVISMISSSLNSNPPDQKKEELKRIKANQNRKELISAYTSKENRNRKTGV